MTTDFLRHHGLPVSIDGKQNAIVVVGVVNFGVARHSCLRPQMQTFDLLSNLPQLSVVERKRWELDLES
jgi:hypothetical protein